MRISQGALLLLATVLLSAAPGVSQTPAKEPTASISGHVTISGKPAVGITVVATISNSFFDTKTVAKTNTDEDGNYKLTALAAGRFTIVPLAKAYVVSSIGAAKQLGQSVNVADGEAVTKIDFALARGGVVTGRITDAEGHPLIGERVNVVLKDSVPNPNSQMSMFGSTRNQTDDRGVYRVYGLNPGSYKVSVGQASSGSGVSIMGMGGSQYLKTFYPGVQDEAKATIIEIKEGTEVANVDITVGKLGNGFTVTGRVIDADSGQPVPNTYLAQSSFDEATQQMGAMNFTGAQSDPSGKFRLEGLRPGHYAVYTFAAGQDSTTYSEPVKFEVVDGDVTGIEIKLRRGATIKGIAVFENNSDPAIAGLLQAVSLYGYVEQKSGGPSYGRGQIGADGSFQITGLAPGKARLGMQGFPTPPKGLSLVRTELDGQDQPEGIEITAGAQINGVRLVFAYGTGSVRGDLKLEGGPLPEGTSIQVGVRAAAGESRRFNRNTEIDARLHFVIENIPSGNYELVVRSVTQTPGKVVPPVELLKQTVTVANGAEVKVNLVVDLTGKKGGQ